MWKMQEKVRLMALMKQAIEKLNAEELEYAKSINVICEKQKRICFGQGRECENCDIKYKQFVGWLKRAE